MLSDQDKNKLIDLVIDILNSHEITKEVKELSNEDSIIVINKIVECVKSSIDITVYLKHVPAEEKPGTVLEIIIEVLSSTRLEDTISPEVREQFRLISNNAEAMNIVLKFVNYLSGELLNSLDNNNDGLVTIAEVESDIVDCLMCKNAGGCGCYEAEGCCKCCPDLSKKIGGVLAKFFIKVLCCGCEKNHIPRRS